MLAAFPMNKSILRGRAAHFLCLLGGAAWPLAAGAANGEGTAGTESSVSLLDLVRDTGVMFYPLALLSVAAVFLIVYYAFAIRQGTVVSDKFMRTADVLLRQEDHIGLLEVCERRSDSIARVAEKMLDFVTKNPGAPFEKVREVGESEGSRQSSLLTQRITYLADVGAIAPMIGLLGTVLGMIKAFREIGSHVVFGDRTTGLASGVSEALLTTAGGLLIGIPALIFYSVFRGRVQRLISDLEAASTHILVLLEGGGRRERGRGSGRRIPARRSYTARETEAETPEDYYSGPSLPYGRRAIDPDKV